MTAKTEAPRQETSLDAMEVFERLKKRQGGVVFAGQVLTDPLSKAQEKKLLKSKEIRVDFLGTESPSSIQAIKAKKMGRKPGKKPSPTELKRMSAERVERRKAGQSLTQILILAEKRRGPVDTRYPVLDACLREFSALASDLAMSVENHADDLRRYHVMQDNLKMIEADDPDAARNIRELLREA